MKKILVVILVLLLGLRGLAANKYYISSAGNDGATGTSMANSWKTLGKLNSAFATFQPGDSIFLRRGDIFYGGITISKSGSTLAPIVISAYGTGARPIVTGLSPLIFSSAGVNLWQSAIIATLPAYLNTVVQNNRLVPVGRYPNKSAANLGYLTMNSHVGANQVTINSLLNTPNFTGAWLVAKINNSTIEYRQISTHAGTQVNLSSGFTSNPVNGYGAFFINSPLTLDSTSEWYYNPTTKRITWYSATMPVGVEAATVANLVKSTSFSNIVIDNITFRGANESSILVTGGTNFKIQNCDVNLNGVGGIELNQHSGFVVQNNSLFYTQNEAIRAQGFTSGTITNNTIYSAGEIIGMAQDAGGVGRMNGISTIGSNITISYNNMARVGYGGVRWDGNSNTVYRNKVDTFCYIKNDGGALYTQGAIERTSNIVRGNILLNGLGATQGTTVAATQAYGIYPDNNASNIVIDSNSIYNTEIDIFLHGGHSNTVTNNTTYSYKYGFHAWQYNTDLVRGLVISNNIFGVKTATAMPSFFRSTTTDIGSFATTLNNNYYFKPFGTSTSPVIRQEATNLILPMWRTNFPQYDGNSKISPAFVSNAAQVRFIYNATTSPVATSLSGTWVDAKNVGYSGSITLQPYTSALLISTGTLITPTINWSNPVAITYGTALSSTQLNASSPQAGTFTYNYSVGTVLGAGTYTLTTTFTPANPSLYSTATKSVTLTVNKASATLNFGNASLTQTYTGLPLAPSVITTPANLTGVSILYNGVGQTPTNAGSYVVVAGLTNPNYTASSITGTFTITKAPATITVSNTSQTYNGSPKPVTVVTSPVNLSGLSVTYNGSLSVPTNAGSYAIAATLSNQNYTAPTVNTTLVVAKATPTVSWTTPSAITYGTALSGTQLNATASVAGTFTYTPSSGTVLSAGTQTLSVNFTPTDVSNYSPVNNTTVNIVVNQAGTATLSLSNLAQVYDGTAKSATVTTSPVGLGTVTVTYNGSQTLPINAGTYAVVATLSNPNYTASPATGNLVIAKAAATINLSGLTQVYNGTQRVVTATTAPAGLTTVSITYNGSSTPPINAGSYPIVATLNNANYQAANATGTLLVSKATPTIIWNNPSAITYGTALSSTQLNASANTAGTFTYLPTSGTVLNAGTQNLQADFVPTDAANWNSVTDITVSIVVNKATVTINLSNLNQDYDGSPKPVTVLTSPAGLGTVNVTYNGSGTVPSAVGTYPIIATLTNSNYTATPATGNLVISMATGNVAITDVNQIYTGSPLPVTVTTSPGSYSTEVRYNGSLTVPTNVGTYTVIATINDGVHVGADTATYLILKATPTISWSNPSAITYGTALSGTQLNASTGTAGTFAYTPASGTILNAGTQILSTVFTPTDIANYNSTTKTVSLTVNKATATITLSNLTQVYDATPKSAIATTSPIGLDEVTILYDGSPTAPTAVGSYTVSATLTNANYSATPVSGTLVISSASAGISISNILQTYTGSPLPVTVTTNPIGLSYTVTYNASSTVPTNAGTYTVIATITGGTYVGADTQTLVIAKATPVIVWANPSDINFGTALSGTQLNATSTVAGTFAYSPISGTVLNVGNSQSLATTFTPSSTANYNTVSKIVTINVLSGNATLSLSGLTQTYNGTPKPVIVTTSPSGLSGVTILYNGSATVPTNAGAYTINVSLVNSNYTATPVSGTLVISKINPEVSWPLPAPITTGTALTSLQLNAAANVSGTFAYSPTFGEVPPTGTHNISVTFTPMDTVNYNVVTAEVPLSVYGNSNPGVTYYERHGHIIYINKNAE